MLYSCPNHVIFSTQCQPQHHHCMACRNSRRRWLSSKRNFHVSMRFPLAARKAYLELSMFLGFTYGVKEGFIFKCRLVYLWALRHLIISPFQIHIYPLFEFHDRDMMWVFYRCVPLRQFDETMIIQLYSLQQYIQYAVCSFQHIGATTFHDLDLVISILH